MKKDILSGETDTGFKFSIDQRVLNDWDFLEAVAKSASTNDIERLKGTVSVVTMLLGESGVDSLKKHVKSLNGGFCPQDKMNDEIVSMLEKSKAKN